MELSQSPGILTLDTANATTTFNLHNQIPRQVMRLKNVRVEMTGTDAAAGAAAALSQRIIYMDVSWSSTNQLVDNIPTRFYLPILLQEARVTQYVCDLPLYMSHHVPDKFLMVMRNSDGTVNATMAHIALQFEFSYMHIS